MENTVSKVNSEINVSEETSKFALKVGLGMAAFIGIWGVACLASGIISAGSIGVLLKSYFVALAL